MNTVRAELVRLEVRSRECGITRARLCREAGIAQSTWTRWKSGKASPTLSTWLRVTTAFESLSSGIIGANTKRTAGELSSASGQTRT